MASHRGHAGVVAAADGFTWNPPLPGCRRSFLFFRQASTDLDPSERFAPPLIPVGGWRVCIKSSLQKPPGCRLFVRNRAGALIVRPTAGCRACTGRFPSQFVGQRRGRGAGWYDRDAEDRP